MLMKLEKHEFRSLNQSGEFIHIQSGMCVCVLHVSRGNCTFSDISVSYFYIFLLFSLLCII